MTLRPPRFIRALSLLAPFALAACGGGGGGSQAVRNVAPTVTLALQGPSMTDAATTTVHGLASSAAGIAEVSAGGVLAATSDGFATFGVQLPLVLGDNAFNVVARDRSGRTKTVAVPPIRRETPLLAGVSASAIDPTGNFGLSASNNLPNELFLVDTTTGARTRLSGALNGGGSSLPVTFRATFTADGKSILLSTFGNFSDGPIFVVDTSTGDRTALPLTARFAGGLAHDPKRKLVVYTTGSSKTLRIAKLDGSSDGVFSDGNDGKSPPMSQPAAVVYDPTEDDYIVVDESATNPSVLLVSTIDGSRKLLSDLADPGAGPTVASPGPIAIDDAKRELYLFAQNSGAIVRIDLNSGTRTIALAADPNLGPLPALAGALSLEPNSGHLFVPEGRRWIEYDLAAQRRTSFADAIVGSGTPLFFDPFDPDPALFTTPDRSRRRLLLHAANRGIDALDLATGVRAPLVDGSSSAIEFGDVEVGADLDQLLVIDEALPGIQRLDAKTLAATLVSDDTRGSGPNFGVGTSAPTQLAVDAAGGRCFVMDTSNRRLLAVDLATGNRGVLAEVGDGKPTFITFLFGIAYDSLTARLLAIDNNQPGVVVIDPDTGARTLFANVPNASMPDVPKGLCCIDEASHALLVAQRDFGGTQSLIRVDLDDATRSTISSSILDIGTGPAIRSLRSLSCDGSTGRAFGFETSLLALFQIDLESGDRVLIAK